MNDVYKLSIVAVTLYRKHAFDASLLMGRARRKKSCLDVSVHMRYSGGGTRSEEGSGDSGCTMM